LSIALAALAAMAVSSASAQEASLPPAPVDELNFTHRANVPSVGGNNFAFFERQEANGSIRRFVVASNTSHGFDIVEITDPTAPTTVGRFIGTETGNPQNNLNYGPGYNSHAWVDVNPRRNIVVLTIEDATLGSPITGRAPRHSQGTGMQFVDISDVTNPRPLGKVDGLDGPHTVRMIGDNHAYTSLNTYVVDYTNPMDPFVVKADGTRGGNGDLAAVQGHEFWEDPNTPGLGYVGMASTSWKWGLMDLSDPARPKTTVEKTEIVPNGAAHEAYPAPDGSFVGVADFKTGGPNTRACPGGGNYFYDVSGRYKPGAGPTDPIRMGQYFIPFSGLTPINTNGNGTINYGSCTMHSWNTQPERTLGVVGMYQAGTWVMDFSGPTQPGGPYTEYDGSMANPPRTDKTTWGNTKGHNRDALDFVNSAQFLPFDLANAADERIIVTNGLERGLDIYTYDGPMPEKISRLRVDASAPGGVVSGSLDRYAVLTYQGYRNLPLAGKTLTVTSGGTTVGATTGADGSFSADLGLGAGSHAVTVTWAGDDVFRQESVTLTVSG
ncbi:MAG TPA: hypothetical protein VGB28_05110, partial [Actinomycetota bacterium]